MKNIRFLYDDNSKGNIKLEHLRNCNLDYKSKIKYFDFYELIRLIKFFSTAESRYGKFANLKYNIIYSNKNVEFVDKLTYVLFECLLYDQVINRNKNISLEMQYYPTIKTEGIIYSNLRYVENKEIFDKFFNYDVSNYHFRKVIKFDELSKRPEMLSLIMSDLEQFLITCGIKKEEAHQVTEISIELIDNAIEHSCSDCIFDIDVTKNPYYKSNIDKEEYKAVNMAIIDFSENTLGLGVKNILESNNYENKLYEKLSNIKKLHEKHFDLNYTKEQFYLMATFQNKITSRLNSNLTGGKGLTKLIKGLQESADSDLCYVVSKDNCLFFVKENIKQDDLGWVGFNEQNNCELPPNKEALKKSPLNIIGTAYNLSFVLKQEKYYD